MEESFLSSLWSRERWKSETTLGRNLKQNTTSSETLHAKVMATKKIVFWPRKVMLALSWVLRKNSISQNSIAYHALFWFWQPYR